MDDSPAAAAQRLPDDGPPPSAPNLATLVAARVRDRGHAPFLTFYDGATGERTELSYATFDNWASKTANLLVEELELGRGDRVATVLGNHWTALVIAVGCWKVGCCVLALPDNAHAAATALTEHATQAVFVREDLLEPLLAACGDAVPPHALAVGVGLGARLSGQSEVPADVLPYAEEVLAFGDDYDDPAVTLADDALLVPSVDAGAPAGVRLTQGNLLAAAEAVGAWGVGRDDRVLCAQPAHLTDGLVLAHLGPFAAGASVVLTRAYDPERLWRRAGDERATILALSSAQLDALPEGAPPAGLRCALVASGAASPVLARAGERIPVAVGHGVVEATCASSLSALDPDRDTRAWLAAAPGRAVGAVTARAAVAALDERGAPVAPGARGRLAVRGPVVMAGYDGRDDLDEQAFAAGWLATADHGFTDLGPDGRTHVFVTGTA